MRKSGDTNANQELADDFERSTFILRSSLIEKVRDVAYWERKLLKEAIEDALETFVANYEKKHGKIKPRPDEVREREKARWGNVGRPKGSGKK